MKRVCFPPQFQLLGIFSSKGTLILLVSLLVIGFYSCTTDRSVDSADFEKDTDGDGIMDNQEVLNGTNKNNPCDPVQNSGYTSYDALNILWSGADCDNDGINNSHELSNATNPYLNESLDADGDGIENALEIQNGTDKDNPCDPAQSAAYTAFNASNSIWSTADCDADGITNGDEIANNTNPYLGSNIYSIPEFLPKLSELQLFEGPLADLKLNDTVHEYNVSTPLFTDCAYIFRSIALPNGGQMVYNGQDLLLFPDNTILAKTLYYPNDERNYALGKKVIETQVLIKKNGVWNVGNYFWNDEQTEAYLDEGAHVVQIDWIDNLGNDRTVNYKVSPKILCFQCHNNNGSTRPIGPKSRALNFVHNGKNQIQYFIDIELLTGAPDVSQIAVLPDWSDNSLLLEDRARAYLDVNCAHCHQPGGSYNTNYGDSFEFRFETAFEDSNISEVKVAIRDRMATQISSYFMPLIGTTVIHKEGVELINEYIDSLE